MTRESRFLLASVALACVAVWPADRTLGLLVLVLAAAPLRWSRDVA